MCVSEVCTTTRVWMCMCVCVRCVYMCVCVVCDVCKRHLVCVYDVCEVCPAGK